LTLQYDRDGETFALTLNKTDLIERLKTVKQILGRPLTLQDAKLAIIKIINETRAGQKQLTEQFDFTQWIGTDLES